MAELDRIVHITVGRRERNEFGETITVVAFEADAWARRQDFGVSSRAEDEGIRSESTSVFEVRYHPIIAAALPGAVDLTSDGATFNVTRINQSDDRRRFLRIEGTREATQ